MLSQWGSQGSVTWERGAGAREGAGAKPRASLMGSAAGVREGASAKPRASLMGKCSVEKEDVLEAGSWRVKVGKNANEEGFIGNWRCLAV